MSETRSYKKMPSTVEPRFTVTSLVRSPLQYGHDGSVPIFVSTVQRMGHVIPVIRSPLH